MSSMTMLLIQIRQVLIDLKNDKVTARTKALDELTNIFDNRAQDLRATFRSNNNNHMDDDDRDTFNWSDLFDGLHEAIKDQCMRIGGGRRTQSQKSSNSLIGKNDSYKEVVRKCISLANEDVPSVSYAKICHAAFECFETPAMRSHFDGLYIQIVLKNILNAKHSLSELKVAEWSRKCFLTTRMCSNHIIYTFLLIHTGLLSHVFELFNESSERQKLELLQCIPLILKHGTKYRYLVSDLHQYLPNVIQIINESQLEKHINAQKQILNIVYEFVRHVSNIFFIFFYEVFFFFNLNFFRKSNFLKFS